jgi:AcrR family transcriptional regulator
LSRPLRADAARNRARVLDAAGEVFDELGPEASTEEVARRAGVGVATVFRHFPTKEALLSAVLVERLTGMAEVAEKLAADGDPATALAELFRHVTAGAAVKLVVHRALEDAGVDVRGARAEVDGRLRAALAALLARAQDAGEVRRDVGVAEVILLIRAASAVAETSRDPAHRDRAVGVLLDGLRPRDAR